ncbi:MAG: sec-independent protein translocase protein TatC [Thermoanaerobaculia bacterium]|jgi:sec-independent protein translocase protein TatC|nr:sec-independent protein translocase protein TatC [Thermoanaerobaculia bacterium]
MSDTAPSTAALGEGSDAPETDLPKMSFLDHLEELRKRLIVAIIAIGVTFLACWNFAEKIYAWVQAPLTKYLPPGDQKLAYTRLTEPFMVYMKVAFFAAIFVASPIIMWQIWSFISPGLYKRERRMAAPFIIFATAFFVLGGYFGYRVLLPGACSFFVETGRQFKQMIKIDEYFSFASMIMLASGVIFETPILIFFLARLGIVTPAFLLQKSKWAIVLAFIISAILTPSPDMVNQTMLALPMIGLYFIGVGVAFLFGKRHDK